MAGPGFGLHSVRRETLCSLHCTGLFLHVQWRCQCLASELARENRDYRENTFYNLNPLDYFFWGMLKVYLLKIRNKCFRYCIRNADADTVQIHWPMLDIHCNFAECSKRLLMRGITLNIPCIVLCCTGISINHLICILISASRLSMLKICCYKTTGKGFSWLPSSSKP